MKNKSYKIALAASAAVAAGAIGIPQIAHSQERAQEAPRVYVGAEDPKLREIVTVRFNDASVREVLDWLGQRGVSYVVDDSELLSRHVSLNIDHQPLRDAVRAFADVLGGHWEKHNNVYTFHKGRAVDGVDGSFFRSFAMPQTQFKDLGQLPEQRFFPNTKDIPNFNGQDMEKFGKEMEKWGENFAKSFEGKNFEGQGRKMTPEEEKKFRQDMEKWGQNFRQNFNFNFKDMDKFQGLSPEDIKKLHQGMEKFHQNFNSKDMQGLYGRNMTPEQRKKFEQEMAKAHQNFRFDFNSKDMPKWHSQGDMNPEEMKKFHQDMEKWQQDFQKNFKPNMEKYAQEMKAWAQAHKNDKSWSSKDGKAWIFRGDDNATPEERAWLKEHGLPPIPPMPPLGNLPNGQMLRELQGKDGVRFYQYGNGGKADQLLRELKTKDGVKYYQYGNGSKMPNAQLFRELNGKDLQRFEMDKDGVFRALPKGRLPEKMDGLNFVYPNVVNKGNVDRLLKSITPAQRELQARRGYLRPSDLTPAQRELLGSVSKSGDWTIQYNVNGQKLTIRNK